MFGLGKKALMKGQAAIFLLGVLTVASSAAQTSQDSAALPSFEVATIRATPPGRQGNSVWSPPGVGRFSADSVSLEFLVEMAFGMDHNQITGGPKWLDSVFYDVVAKPESGISLTRDELRPRLQSLLEQRFHLATHFETQLVRGYVLLVAEGGPKLKPSAKDKPPGFRVYVGPGRIEGLNWSMPYLAAMLQRPAGLPVADKTGVAGSFDIKLEFAPDIEQPSSLPSLFTALRETLGLELKAQKVPVQILVIDHIDRVPTDN